MEAVEVLARRAKDSGVAGGDREKLTELTDLAQEISDARERFAQDNLDQILTSVTELGRDGHVDHAALPEIKHLAGRLDKR